MIENNVLRITSTPGQLGYNITNSQLKSSYVPAKLDIDTTNPVISSSGCKVTLKIDATVCKAEEGHKTIKQLTNEFAEKGIQDAQASAQQAVAEGNELLKQLPQNPNAIAQMELSKLLADNSQLELITIPSQPPKISFSITPFHLNVKAGTTKINWVTTPTANAELIKKGNCETYLKQAPSMHVQYVGNYNSLDQYA